MAARLPDFVIIGAQKAGTTWLGYRLLEQPGIYLPRPFEAHFFDRADNYSKGLDWYSSRFADAPPGTIVGEKTPDYFWAVRPKNRGPNDIPERMHKDLPDAKLIVVLRDPVKRAVSALNHFMRGGWLSPFINPDTILLGGLDPAKDRFGLISRGLYLTHLQRFLSLYPREQIHVVLFEDDIKKAPHDTVKSAMSFLGIEAGAPVQLPARPENQRMNSRLGLITNYYAPILSPLISMIDRTLPLAPEIAPSASCETRLREYFRPHNQALFDFLGRKSEAWMAA